MGDWIHTGNGQRLLATLTTLGRGVEALTGELKRYNDLRESLEQSQLKKSRSAPEAENLPMARPQADDLAGLPALDFRGATAEEIYAYVKENPWAVYLPGEECARMYGAEDEVRRHEEE
tara:strand:- start:189 stop:545 length:357 start_codon:yes stop_codon:yes gene_type:complete